ELPGERSPSLVGFNVKGSTEVLKALDRMVLNQTHTKGVRGLLESRVVLVPFSLGQSTRDVTSGRRKEGIHKDTQTCLGVGAIHPFIPSLSVIGCHLGPDLFRTIGCGCVPSPSP